MNQFILLLIMMNNIIFNIMKHPLILTICLFFQIMLICGLMGICSQTYWFSYILFLIFIGGMLILFMYMISLMPNEKYNINNSFKFIFLMIFLLITLFYMKWSFNINNLEIKEFSFLNLMFEENSNNLNKLFNFPNNIINIFLIIFLFLMLMITIKITNFNMGPFRLF